MTRQSLLAIAALAIPLSAAGAERCIAMADAATGKWLVHQGQCDARLPPMSSFKVALSLMGYDSGVLRNEHAPLLPFKKGYVDWRSSWRQPTDPIAWMKESVVWYSQQLTRRLGEQRFASYVQRFGYGNGDVSGDAGKHNGLTDSWLSSSLRISADEQVTFLRRAVNHELGLKPQAYTMTDRLTRLPALVDGWQVHGKTGSGSPVLADGTPDDARRLGWYVGWLSKGDRRIVFAQMAVREADGSADAPLDSAPMGIQVKEDFLRQLLARLSAQSSTPSSARSSTRSPTQLSDEAARVRAAVDSAIVPLMAAHKLPGMAVAVTLHGRPYYFNYGVASLDSGAPVTERTIFELGSVSKTFTATLGAYAQGLGKLSLDAHPSRYAPYLQGSAVDRATLLQLATYAAGGLPLQVPDNVSKGDVEHYLRNWTATTEPGATRVYSNPSIGLFGQLAALALQRPFDEALEQLIFPKFGLTSTYVNVPPAAMAQYAWGYDDGKPIRVMPGPFDYEAYGVKSTSADMLRVVQANLNPASLDPQLRRAVLATHVPYFDVGPMQQGLGWEQYRYPAKIDQLLAGIATSGLPVPVKSVPPVLAPAATWFHKTGSTNGFGSYVVFVPERQTGIVMLANQYYPNADRVKAAHAILTGADVDEQ